MPTKIELQMLSGKRLEAVKDLYQQGHYDIVCADSGYVLEFGLKAAVCTYRNQNNYPEQNRKYKTHNLDNLVDFANLRNSLDQRKSNSLDFFTNWSLVSKWSPELRYEPIGKNTRDNAEQNINAIENERDGVYPWIKENW